MKNFLLLFAMLALFSCNEEESKTSNQSKEKLPKEDLEKISPDPGEKGNEAADTSQKADDLTAESGDAPIEESKGDESKDPEKDPLNFDPDVILHDIELSSGSCTFAVENETKEKTCELLLDTAFSDCVVDARKKVHEKSCGDPAVSFEDAVNDVIGN